MKDLKTIMIEYANAHGRGLPLTPEEMCNAVVIWVQQFVEQSGGGSQITVAQLFELIKGSETVDIDENEEGTALEVHLDRDVVNKLEKALLTPVSPPQEETFVAISTNGSQTNVPKSVLDQRYRLYKHGLDLHIYDVNADVSNTQHFLFDCINNYEQPFGTDGEILDDEWWKKLGFCVPGWYTNDLGVAASFVIIGIDTSTGYIYLGLSNGNEITIKAKAASQVIDIVTPL